MINQVDALLKYLLSNYQVRLGSKYSSDVTPEVCCLDDITFVFTGFSFGPEKWPNFKKV